MSQKTPKQTSERLLKLLYKTASTELAPKNPIVTRYLYEREGEEHVSSSTSVLDDLRANQWRQKPIDSVLEDIPATAETKEKSCILKFNCPNSFLDFSDFYNIYPINRERKYFLSDDLRRGIQLKTVKARSPSNLLFMGSYYLVFPNYKHACVYWMETVGKQLNGYDLKLKFVRPSKEIIEQMSSPFFDPDINTKLSGMSGGSPLSNIKRKSIFEISPAKHALIDKIIHTDKTRPVNYETLDIDPAYEDLCDFLDLKERVSSVLVRNLPFGLSKHALPKLLWDYDFAPLPNLSSCFTTIHNDPTNQLHLTLIRFANKDNAVRFVRNFHGRRWESVQSGKEKKLHEPLLCEIID
ncbi:Piso0_002502 [Millerozyma farinosa CBS 7064]|uniref:Piso0_002502 protein n=1 Tax=Pichia sorbitophila (strain ATCC MYA-4447 / BCRC 22081 / CBS 7064 / NBRC 10061 / NRRL Y-12695) TaxID=559304 RepID=G8YF78_PICSO|nr:Piso0_002502 [Millerozyma farinosa CBS 7064]